MRICVCGAGGVGKSTFVKGFLENWPSYECSGESYRKLIEEKKLSLNKDGNQESQEIILNCLLDEAMKYTSEDNVIHDRGTIDNLVYTLWHKAKDENSITEEFMKTTFQLVKTSMLFYDVIFYIPYNDTSITEEVKETRETDTLFNREIDNFFKGVNSMYYDKNESLFPFSDEKGVPALIEIFGNCEERLEIAKLYVDPDGKNFGEEDSLISKFLSSEEIAQMTEIMGEATGDTADLLNMLKPNDK